MSSHNHHGGQNSRGGKRGGHTRHNHSNNHHHHAQVPSPTPQPTPQSPRPPKEERPEKVDDPNRKFFDKSVRDDKFPLNNARVATDFFNCAVTYYDPTEYLERLLSTHDGSAGLKRLSEAVNFCSDHNCFFNGFIPFLKHLSSPEVFAGTRQLLVYRVLGTVINTSSLGAFKSHLIDDSRSADDELIAWMLVTVINSPLNVDRELSRHPTIVEFYNLFETRSPARASVIELGTSLQQNTTIHQTAHVPTQVPGGRHDNDFEDYRRISILPTKAEASSAAPAYLPKTLQLGDDLGYLDSQFRLLREDVMGPLKDALNEPPVRRKILYITKLKGISVDFDQSFLFNFKLPSTMRQSKFKPTSQELQAFWDRSKLFAKGALVCLVSATSEPIAFGVIARHNVTELADVSPCIGVVFGSEQCIKAVLSTTITAEGGLSLLQVSSSFFAMEPSLQAMQRMTAVPFGEELVGSNFVDETGHPHAARNAAQLLECVLSSRGYATLNDSQKQAAVSVAKQRVSLIQGPPGTGKTHVAVFIAKTLLQDPNTRIMCVCYTNHALDQFLEALVDAGITKVVRVGGRCKSQKLEKYRLNYTRAPATRAVMGRINELKSKLFGRCFGRDRDIVPMGGLAAEISRLFARLDTSISWNDVELLLTDEQYADFLPPKTDFVHKSDPKSTHEAFVSWTNGKTPASLRDRQIWRLTRDQRDCLYAQWQSQVQAGIRDDIYDAIQQFQRCKKELDLYDQEGQIAQLKTAKVIGCTTWGAARYGQLLENARTPVVMVEEAAEILEAHVLTSITSAARQLIMIGDHEQLRPKVENYNLSVERGLGFELNCSLFERLVKASFPISTLAVQHRMHPEISAIVRHMTYPHLVDHASVQRRPTMKGVAGNVVFVNHNRLESKTDQIENAKTNNYEADMVVATIQHLLHHGYKDEQIVVLTPYLGQLVVIDKKLKVKLQQIDVEISGRDMRDLAFNSLTLESSSNDKPKELKIRVSTVDNYQGEESDIIVASMVRSNDSHQIGFLRDSPRLNVLVSRARVGLIMIGNLTTLCQSKQGGALWTKFQTYLAEHNYIYAGFPAVCSKHPSEFRLVTSAADFQKHCPEGCCLRPCKAPLSCGHECPKTCHKSNDHSQMKCSALVHHVCENQHPSHVNCHTLRTSPSRLTCAAKSDYACAEGHVTQVTCGSKTKHCTVCSEIAKAERRAMDARALFEKQQAEKRAQFELKMQDELRRQEAATSQLMAQREAEERKMKLEEARLLAEASEQRVQAEAERGANLAEFNLRMDELRVKNEICLRQFQEQRELEEERANIALERLRVEVQNEQERLMRQQDNEVQQLQLALQQTQIESERKIAQVRRAAQEKMEQLRRERELAAVTAGVALRNAQAQHDAQLQRQQAEPLPSIYPPYWSEHHAEIQRVDVTGEMLQQVQLVVDQTCLTRTLGTGVDQKQPGSYSRLRVVRVVRVENLSLYAKYHLEKDTLNAALQRTHAIPLKEEVKTVAHFPAGPMHQHLNEVYLFHGTDLAKLNQICKGGFDERIGELGGLYGAGVYFAENSSKADQYARCTDGNEFAMILARVSLGAHLYHTNIPLNKQRLLPEIIHGSGERYTATIGALGYHKEFVVYRGVQAYPEYLVSYVRE